MNTAPRPRPDCSSCNGLGEVLSNPFGHFADESTVACRACGGSGVSRCGLCHRADADRVEDGLTVCAACAEPAPVASPTTPAPDPGIQHWACSCGDTTTTRDDGFGHVYSVQCGCSRAMRKVEAPALGAA